ncbi:MAG: hypothetical protein Kow0060_14540 [Methylohalobius crimeensis]
MGLNRFWGLIRSFRLYYGSIEKRRQMDRFYAQFVRRGALCFDIGSHVGNRIGCWRRLGARVVAVEPQPDCVRFLRWTYGGDSAVSIDPHAVGRRDERVRMLVSSRTPTVSTLSPEWIEEVRKDPRFSWVNWDRTIDVEMITLDRLIVRYGEPSFCKIDVEGLETDVLSGLSRPLPALSFEYIPAAISRALACIDLLSDLGRYVFRHSEAESMCWRSSRWMRAEEMKAVLERLPFHSASGDVYARLGW